MARVRNSPNCQDDELEEKSLKTPIICYTRQMPLVPVFRTHGIQLDKLNAFATTDKMKFDCPGPDMRRQQLSRTELCGLYADWKC